MKLAVNLTISLGLLVLFVWLVWPNEHEREGLRNTLTSLDFSTFWPWLAGYVGLLATTHFFRAYRWNNLLAPIGARQPLRRLLAISSIGFMAILALPARLGEFARPALLRERGRVSGSAVLGTVAVERIVDGLLVSILVFACCVSLRGPQAPGWMMPTAWASLGIFVAATTFLGFALRWPERTVATCVTLTGARWFSSRIAAGLERMLTDLIRGFLVLKDRRNLALFGAWSALYWGANGFATWVLARGMGLEISVIGAFATMGIVAVGITLPNTPGLVGQFHKFTMLGLSLYLPDSTVKVEGLAYALLLHGLQVIWYVGVGAIAMFTSHVRFADLWRRSVADPPAPSDSQREVA